MDPLVDASQNKNMYRHTLTSMYVSTIFPMLKQGECQGVVHPRNAGPQEAVMGCLQYARLEELDDEEVKPKKQILMDHDGGYTDNYIDICAKQGKLEIVFV